jgi:hypothetical protein
MNNVITIGKRLIPVEQIVLVEPFDPASNPGFKSDRDFKARIVLHNRDTVLTEDTPDSFAETRGFRWLAGDHMAVNPSIAFRIEVFAPTEDFKTERRFATRLKWRDAIGVEQSKLLVAEPDRHCDCPAQQSGGRAEPPSGAGAKASRYEENGSRELTSVPHEGLAGETRRGFFIALPLSALGRNRRKDSGPSPLQ